MTTRTLDRRHRATATPVVAVVAVVAIVAILASLAVAPLALAAPNVVVSPPNGIPGAALKATASGFPVGPVEFLWDGAISLGTVATNENGRAIQNFNIPANAVPGEHFVRACAPSCAVSAQGRVTVVPPPTPTPAPTAPPTPTPTRPPTPPPTPRITPRPPNPTPRPPDPTPRPPGATAQPPAAPTVASPAASGSGAASPGSSAAPLPTFSAAPVASVSTGETPTAAGSTPSATAVPLVGGPTRDDPFLGGVIGLGALIVGLILAGFVITRLRGRGRELADVSQAGAMTVAGTGGDVVAPAIGPEPEVVADPWPSAKTIAIQVEQIDPGED